MVNYIYIEDEPNTNKGGLGPISSKIINSPNINTIVVGPKCSIKNIKYIHIIKFGSKGNGAIFIIKLVPMILDIFLILASKISKRKIIIKKCNIYIFIGNDWRTIVRGYILGLIFGLKINFYFVDNVIDYIHKKPEGKFINYILLKLIKLNHIEKFAITQDLSIEIAKLTKTNCNVKMLPYQFTIYRNNKNNKFTNNKPTSFSIIGSITPYVISGLKWLGSNYFNSCNMKIPLIIYSSNNTFCLNPDYINLKQFYDINIHLNLKDHEIIEQSEGTIFVSPYSFDDVDRKFVSESFPSKTLKYIDLGLPTLVISPKWASIVKSHSGIINCLTQWNGIEDFNKICKKVLMCNNIKIKNECANLHNLDNFYYPN